MTAVALLHYAAPPVIGGVESVIAAHAVRMAADGHLVRLVAGRGGVTIPGVELRIVELADPLHPAIQRIQPELNAGRVPAELGPAVEELVRELDAALAGFEVLIAHNVCSLGLNLALTAAVRVIADRGSPRVILWHHDLAASSPEYLPLLHPGRPWDLLREAWPGTLPVVVSAGRRNELAALTGLDPARIEVIPNGIDLAVAWGLHPRAAVLAAELRHEGADPILLVPARITPRKNIELALRVVSSLRLAGRPAAVVVTGPVDPHRPNERDYLARLLELRSVLGLESAARFLATEPVGAPPDAVVDDLYRLADVLFLPSRDEGFGLPILEAGANRLPVACADLPVLREIAGDEALYFSPDEDPVAIATVIAERLAGDPAWRLRRRVLADYALDAIYRDRIAPLLA